MVRSDYEKEKSAGIFTLRHSTMEKIKNLHHVAIIVKDMESELTFWRDTLGLKLTEMEDNPGESAKIAFLPLSGSILELIQPLSEESGLIRFIKKLRQAPEFFY